MNNNYDTDDLDFADLQAQVTNIHICAYLNEHNEGDEVGNPPTNHWAAFLQHAPENSVRLDMAPGYGSDGLRGKIEISSKSYVSTYNSIKTFSFRVKTHATVQSITDLINSKGRDKYKFTEECEGCRFWIYTFIADLESAGIIEERSKQAVWEAVSLYWRSPSGSEPRKVKEGAFY